MATVGVPGHEGQIELLTLSDHTWRAVSVEPGWDNFRTLLGLQMGKVSS
jgi:hypothetical protein